MDSISKIKFEYGLMLFMVIAAIVIDIVTGFLKAKISCSINSNDAFKGFWKKISLLAGLTFGIFLDILERYIISFGIDDLKIEIPFSIPIGLIIGIYITINECISICENLYLCGVKLPPFVIRFLKNAQKIVSKDDDIS